MRIKGRHWVLLWLAIILVVAAAVLTRQQYALRTAAQLRVLREQRGTLEARRAELERRIQDLQGRGVLPARAAAKLGLHQPTSSEFEILRLGGTGDSAAAAPPANPSN